MTRAQSFKASSRRSAATPACSARERSPSLSARASVIPPCPEACESLIASRSPPSTRQAIAKVTATARASSTSRGPISVSPRSRTSTSASFSELRRLANGPLRETNALQRISNCSAVAASRLAFRRSQFSATSRASTMKQRRSSTTPAFQVSGHSGSAKRPKLFTSVSGGSRAVTGAKSRRPLGFSPSRSCPRAVSTAQLSERTIAHASSPCASTHRVFGNTDA